jgi:hypothetical protein
MRKSARGYYVNYPIRTMRNALLQMIVDEVAADAMYHPDRLSDLSVDIQLSLLKRYPDTK